MKRSLNFYLHFFPHSIFGFMAGATLFFSASASAQTEVKSIEFQVSGQDSVINIITDSPAIFEESKNIEDKQLIVDISNAKLGPMATRKLDTSSFDSPVTLVSPYPIGQGPENVRVVIQLRKDAIHQISQVENRLTVKIDSGKANSSSEVVEPSAKQSSTASTQSPNSSSSSDPLGDFIQNRETKNFKGTPVTLQVRDANIKDVFRLISEASGFNIILGPGVDAKITLSLVDVPWDQALDVILQTLKLGAERNHNVLRIMTLANLTAEKQLELAAKQAQEATAPRITRLFPLSYADIKDVAKILNTFRKSHSGSKGTIEVDKRTNSVIVQDTQENLDRMAKIIELMDTQTPQVLVESKIVEATEGTNFSIGGGMGIAGTGSNQNPFFVNFNGVNPTDDLIATTGANATTPIFTGSQLATNAAGGGGFGFQPKLAFLRGGERITAVLSIKESENQVKVISSPRLVVLNKEKAKILQSTPVLVNTTITSETGVPIPVSQIQDANLSLDVTPTITNDENVLMELKISRDVPLAVGASNNGIGKRNVDSKVLVQSGSTLVIGGIYVAERRKNSSGFPVLKDIPLIGVLFGAKDDTTNKNELFIFVTPRILNIKKAGIAGV